MTLRRVVVDLCDRSYEVLVGRGARRELGSLLPFGTRRAAMVVDSGLDEVLVPDPGVPTIAVRIAGGESGKRLRHVESLCRSFARGGLTRADVVIAVGGGATTDLAGFAAAIYHRGTAVIHLPTTLLGQVDAAVGGKTAVNLPEGKNLVGVFWQPHAVICDTELLASLPEPEWRSGRGEMVKYAFLGVPSLQGLCLEDQIAACVEAKAATVAADEREGGRRALLNYGHTLAHALEGLGSPLRHGEAVAVGLVFAACLAEELGRIDAERVRHHVELVAAEHLPTAVPDGWSAEALLAQMARDKKAVGGLSFVLDGRAGLELVHGIAPEAVRAALLRQEAINR